MRSSFSMPLLYHAYVYLEFLILACTIYILAPRKGKEEMTKEERKKRVQEAWKKLKTTSRDSKEFKEVLTTWNKLDTEYLKLYNEEY